jgi:biopolymer transport protein ExbD
MAGGGGGESSADNPLPLNVVPLIDVIFCLLLFFMCSFHFKTLEGKMEAWLPQDKGNNNSKVTQTDVSEIRISLEWDKVQARTIRRFGRTEYSDDNELANTMKDQYDRNKAIGKDAPVIIQPNPDVPWSEVVKVMDLARQKQLPKMEFALAKSELVLRPN